MAAPCSVPKGLKTRVRTGPQFPVFPSEPVPTKGHGRQQTAESRALPPKGGSFPCLHRLNRRWPNGHYISSPVPVSQN